MKKSYYFLSIFILFLFNTFNVNALESNFENLEVHGYNNNGNSLTAPSEFGCSVGSCGMQITTYANSYGGAWVIQSPIPIINNHNYALSLRIRSSNYEITLSSKPQIALGTATSAKTNYQNNNFQNELITYRYGGNSTLQYYFKSLTNEGYIVIPFTTQTNTTADFMIDSIVIEDLGAESMSQDQVNNIINNQTAIIQSDINNLEDSFNNTIKDTFENCESSDNLFTSTFINGSLDTTGGITHGYDGWSVVTNDFISVKPNTTYTFSNKLNYRIDRVVYYTNTKAFISRTNSLNSSTFTTPEGAYYIRFNIWNEGIVPSDLSNVMLNTGSTPKPFEPICKNKLDSLNDTQKETNDKLDSLNDNITNSDSSEATGEASDFFSNFNTDTFGLTSVITAPLELIKSITSKSCTPLHGTLPFVSTEVNLPCLSTIYENYFGSFLTIYRTITFGFVSYWVCIKIFNLVKDFKNPEHDEIEVLDL